MFNIIFLLNSLNYKWIFKINNHSESNFFYFHWEIFWKILLILLGMIDLSSLNNGISLKLNFVVGTCNARNFHFEERFTWENWSASTTWTLYCYISVTLETIIEFKFLAIWIRVYMYTATEQRNVIHIYFWVKIFFLCCKGIFFNKKIIFPIPFCIYESLTWKPLVISRDLGTVIFFSVTHNKELDR